MKESTGNIDVFSGRGFKKLLLVAIMALPLYFAVEYIIHDIQAKDSFIRATLVTLLIIACIYAGRYMAMMWVGRVRRVSRTVFIITGAIIIACILAVFFVAQVTSNGNEPYLRALFISLPLFILFVCAGIFIKFTRLVIASQLTEARAGAAQSQDELRFLQTQLSPHFLFNTLNNMYGLSLTQHEKIPGLLLKLSDLLRYSVYDAKELFVPLASEIAYIKDYIDFEKIRMGEKLVLSAALDVEGSTTIKIAPLLLIVFIENAFKHSKNTTEQKIYIDISLQIWANSILFGIKNSKKNNAANGNMIDTSSGFGLDNVMRRLDLLYKNEYDIKIDNKDDEYTVMLQLKVK